MADTTVRFTAVPSPDGTIRLPRDAARRTAGALAVEVVLTLRETDARTEARGITPQEVAAVAAVQRIEPDVALYTLGGEGSVSPDSPLYSSLHRLLSAP